MSVLRQGACEFGLCLGRLIACLFPPAPPAVLRSEKEVLTALSSAERLGAGCHDRGYVVEGATTPLTFGHRLARV